VISLASLLRNGSAAAAFAAVVLASCADPAVPTLEVTPERATLTTGESLRLTVTRRYASGPIENVTQVVAYVSSDVSAVRVGEAGGSRGVLTAYAVANPVLIRVVDPSSDATAIATLSVVPASIVSIDVQPSPALVLPKDGERQLTATATYNNKTTADVTAQMSWQSSNLAAASVGNGPTDKGLVKSVATGDTIVTATDPATGVQGRTTIFVAGDAPSLKALIVTPNPAVVINGGTVQFVAQGVFGDGATRDVTRDVQWASSRTDVATIGALGLASGLANGDTTITATDPTTSVRGSAALTVTP
jgi:hypothetical protein